MKRRKQPKTEKDDSGPQLIGYARVSTEDQELRLQTDALERAGCLNIYSEKLSAAARDREQLELAIKDLRPGDTFTVWRLDRLARSIQELNRRINQIKDAGATFKSLTESIDTSTAHGQLLFWLLGAFAEFERNLTIERTKAGILAIQARGLPHGAPIKFTPEKQKRAAELLRQGYSKRYVAKRLKLSHSTIYLWDKARKRKRKK